MEPGAGTDERRVRRRAWSVWGVLVILAVLLLLALPVLLLFELSNSLEEADGIPRPLRARLLKIEGDPAFRVTPPGAAETGAWISGGACAGSSTQPPSVARELEFDRPPERLTARLTRAFTRRGWTATPSTPTVVGFQKQFDEWSAHVVLVVERRGVVRLTGRVDDEEFACAKGVVD